MNRRSKIEKVTSFNLQSNQQNAYKPPKNLEQSRSFNENNQDIKEPVLVMISTDDDESVITNYLKKYPGEDIIELRNIFNIYTVFLQQNNVPENKRVYWFRFLVKYYRDLKKSSLNDQEIQAKWLYYGKNFLNYPDISYESWVKFFRKKKAQQSDEGEECCICYTETVPKRKFLKCNHAICETCTKQLTSSKCPICREEMEGGYYDDVKEEIDKAKTEETILRNLKSDLNAALFNNQNLYRRVGTNFYTLADNYIEFARFRPNVDYRLNEKVFFLFVDFFLQMNSINPDYSTSDAIKNFEKLGDYALDNPNETNFELIDMYLSGIFD